MSPDLLTALAVFAFVSSITPGPNNTMLLASGANFGLRRSAPHMAGVAFGFIFLMLCVGLGLGGLFAAWPPLHDILQILGTAYLLYLAWKVATSSGLGAGEGAARPQTFIQAFLFQWVNPKAWAMALGAMTTYPPKSGYVAGVLLVAAVFGAINAPCIAAWTGFGVALRRYLDRPRVLRAFNIVMAVLMVASLYPVAAEWIGRLS